MSLVNEMKEIKKEKESKIIVPNDLFVPSADGKKLIQTTRTVKHNLLLENELKIRAAVSKTAQARTFVGTKSANEPTTMIKK